MNRFRDVSRTLSARALRAATLAGLAAVFPACASPTRPAAEGNTPIAPPVPTLAAADGGRAGAPLKVKLLAFNDFHGNLRPPTGKVPGVEGPVGGAAYLAAHVKRLRASAPHTVVVSAGDLVGASPLASALFHDEPTVLAMNALGLDVLAVGNHEFDEGLGELLRLTKGGCHAQDGCALEGSYGGAKFAVLGANVFDIKTNGRVFPPYLVREFEGVPVGFIGMTLEGTPNVVAPRGVDGLSFKDEARTAAELVLELQKRRVEAIVLLLHEGGLVRGGGLDDCNDLRGPLPRIVEKLDPAIDVVVSGHTHALYNCRVGSRLVTSALSFGRVVTEIDLTIDRTTRDVVKSEAKNRAITHDVPPDPEVLAIVDRASLLSKPKEQRVIGRIARTIRADTGASGESPLGGVVADAQLAATKKVGAALAVTNLGGLRADLVFPKGSDEPEDGLVTYGEAFTSQPFGNLLVTLTVSGEELIAFLESELKGSSVPQVSSGTTFRWTSSPRKIVGLAIAGKPITPTSRVRLTVNAFLAETNLVLATLAKRTDRVVGASDLEALEAYFRAQPIVDVPKQPRITRD